MNPTREEALFALALEKTAAERGVWLDRECADDVALRQRVEALTATRSFVGAPWQAWRAPSWEEIAAAEAKEKTESKHP
jgi:hypothetical protein